MENLDYSDNLGIPYVNNSTTNINQEAISVNESSEKSKDLFTSYLSERQKAYRKTTIK